MGDGEVFNYDIVSHALTLKDNNTKLPKQSFRIINTEYIENISVISKPTTAPSLKLPSYDMSKIRAFEQRSMRTAVEELKKLELVYQKKLNNFLMLFRKPIAASGKEK